MGVFIWDTQGLRLRGAPSFVIIVWPEEGNVANCSLALNICQRVTPSCPFSFHWLKQFMWMWWTSKGWGSIACLKMDVLEPEHLEIALMTTTLPWALWLWLSSHQILVILVRINSLSYVKMWSWHFLPDLWGNEYYSWQNTKLFSLKN